MKDMNTLINDLEISKTYITEYIEHLENDVMKIAESCGYHAGLDNEICIAKAKEMNAIFMKLAKMKSMLECIDRDITEEKSA